MLRWFKKRHVYAQMACLCAVTLTLLLAFLLGAYYTADANAHRQSGEYAKGLTAQLRRTVENNYSAFQKIIRLISYNRDVQAFLLSREEAERVELFGALKSAIGDVSTLNAQILDIIIETTDRRFVNLMDTLIILPQMDLDDNVLHTSSLIHRRIINTDMDLLVMGKSIYSINSYTQTNQRIGNVYLVLTANAFAGSEPALNDGEGMQLFLVDAYDRLLWSGASADQANYDALNADARKLYYYLRTPLPKLDFAIVAAQETPQGAFQWSDWQTIYLFAFILLLLALMLLWSLWARNLVTPLRRLRLFIERLKRDSLDGLEHRVELSGYREVEVIGSEFNSLLTQTRRLTGELVRANSDLYESKLLAKQSELAHLRSQINPHFLSNTLETMVGIAYTNNQKELAEIARALSIIFKFSIKGENIVPLKSEFKIASNYVSIQHYRFSDRFDVSYRIQEDCLELLVPKMVLQPIIENAIVHGIEQQSGFCHLMVGAHREGRTLCLTVRDDGAGIPEETLGELAEKLRAEERRSGDADTAHIGILNVDSRIKLLYGPTYGITLASRVGEGTLVTITLPVQEGKP